MRTDATRVTAPKGDKRGREPVLKVLGFGTMLLVVLHVPLAMVMVRLPIVGTAHALAVFVYGLVLVTRRRTHELVTLTGYIAGSELLWRASHAAVFWEFGKYSIAALTGLALLTGGRMQRSSKLPLLYLALLLPSIAVMPEFDAGQVSFNLSGPLALAGCSMLFSSIELTREKLQKVMVATLMPTVGLGAIASYGTLMAEELEFGGGSSFTTSGGIGPNQVSSILGLGIFAAAIVGFGARSRRGRTAVRWFVYAILFWLIVQCLLTFSRGGVLTAAGAITVGGVWLLRDRRSRVTFVVSACVLSAAVAYGVLPALDRFTGGALERRYLEKGATGRLEIAKADLMAYQEHPVLGVGPHQSKEYHARTFRFSSTHTEFTRMLAEHGSFGLGALLVLAAMTAQRFVRPLPADLKAYSIGMTVWALLFMTHAAMRLVAPSFLFGLASARFVEDAAPVPRRARSSTMGPAGPGGAPN